MYVILLGGPGAGKGTIAKILAKDLNLTHISTGDIFRKEMKNKTKLGTEIVQYMDNGLLVPDDIVLEVVEKRLKKSDAKEGAILDGFPRTVVQAEAFEEFLKIYNPEKKIITVELDVKDQEIIKRITNRLTCSNEDCKAIYNLETKPPKVRGICDICGEELIRRADDTKETIKRRLQIYHKNSKELINFYKKNNALYSITPTEANETVENIKKYLNKIEGSN